MKWVWAASLILVVGALVYALSVKDSDVQRPQALSPRAKGPVLEAKVVRFGSIPSRWRRDVVIVASTPDGRTGHDVLPLTQLDELDCKVGDPVSARMVGSVLVVDALTCGKSTGAEQRM